MGTNIAGTVTKLGPSVSSFSIGDKVFGLGSPNHPTPDKTGLQEYAILGVQDTAKVPSGFKLDDLVTFPVNATTSFAALFNEKGLGLPAPLPSTAVKEYVNLSTETILIIGGGSSVGKLALQMSKMAGVGTILTIASAANEDVLKGLGATHVIDRRLSPVEILAQVWALTNGDGVTKIYDCVSWEYSLPISLLSPTKPCTLLTLHPCEEAEKVVKEKGIGCRVQFILGTSDFLQPLTKPFWEALPGWVEERKLAVGKYRVIDGLDSLKEIEEGLDGYRDGKPITPVVVHPQGKA